MRNECSAPILSPVLLRNGDSLVAVRVPLFKRVFGFRHEGGDLFSYLEPARGHEHKRIEWLMGRDGLFRQVEEVELLRPWARPLNRLLRVCRVKVRLHPGIPVKAADFLPKIEGSRGPMLMDLRQHLHSMAADAVFSPDDFHAVMREPHGQDTASFP
jgi:hypothetical protein